LLEYLQPGFDAEEISGIVSGVFKNISLHGIAPMNITPGRDSYTNFPLRLLHVPKDEFLNQINVILSDSYEHTTGETPTSVKTQYLIEVAAGTFDPELLLLIAAVKSKMVYGNYTRTTYPELMKRMYGGRPWRIITRRFYDRLMNEAIERKMLVKIKSWKSFYISIRYTADQLASAIIADKEKRKEPQYKIKMAAKRIAEYQKTVH
jgi:hypothetical protein